MARDNNHRRGDEGSKSSSRNTTSRKLSIEELEETKKRLRSLISDLEQTRSFLNTRLSSAYTMIRKLEGENYEYEKNQETSVDFIKTIARMALKTLEPEPTPKRAEQRFADLRRALQDWSLYVHAGEAFLEDETKLPYEALSQILDEMKAFLLSEDLPTNHKLKNDCKDLLFPNNITSFQPSGYEPVSRKRSSSSGRSGCQSEENSSSDDRYRMTGNPGKKRKSSGEESGSSSGQSEYSLEPKLEWWDKRASEHLDTNSRFDGYTDLCERQTRLIIFGRQYPLSYLSGLDINLSNSEVSYNYTRILLLE
ncbi:hypothetical protein P280DRAFT_481085 [Massarina eburnea CBS 473.64]|uniref:Uncharacterized protein n=1 Tax=Massarina eburnea CBS 473.64 TaxID=1395130 RepID=A0A6A6RWD7_9PLEO|nr:hypothetical protein P280DRAFT_481085 [Massarina eburnea CBS 473.64]